MSADSIGIGLQINIDIRCWIDVEFWSPDITTKMYLNINVLCCCVPAGN